MADPPLPPAGIVVGQGYNSATGEAASTGIVAYNPDNESHELLPTGNRDVLYTLQQIHSSDDLASALNISTSASFGWGVFSGGSSFDVVRSERMSSYSNFLFLQVLVQTGDKVLRQSVLTPLALQKIREGNIVDFLGNEYLYGKRLGGSFTAVLQFTSHSQAEQNSVSLALSGSVPGIVSGEGSVTAAINAVKTISEVEIFVHQVNGTGSVAGTPDALMHAAQQFPTSITPTDVLAYLTRTYNGHIDNLPVNFPSLDSLQHLQTNLGIISGYLNEAYRRAADLRFAQQHLDQFNGNQALIAPALDELQRHIIPGLIQAAEDQKRNFRNNPPPPPMPNFSTVEIQRVGAVPVVQPESVDTYQAGSQGPLQDNGWQIWFTHPTPDRTLLRLVLTFADVCSLSELNYYHDGHNFGVPLPVENRGHQVVIPINQPVDHDGNPNLGILFRYAGGNPTVLLDQTLLVVSR